MTRTEITLGKHTQRYHANGLPQTLRQTVVAVVGVGRRYLEVVDINIYSTGSGNCI